VLKSYNKSVRDNVLLMSCQGKLHVQPGHAPITRTMSQTSVNEDADLASDVAISPSKTKSARAAPPQSPSRPSGARNDSAMPAKTWLS
jgi:hypothetical protein